MTNSPAKIPAKSPQDVSRMHGTNKGKGLADLFLHGIQDIYYAEKKLTAALPKMIKAAKSQDLVDALTGHLSETEEHVQIVQEIFQSIGKPAKAKKCEAIDGIVNEADSIMKEFGGTPAGDAAIIFAGQAAEHYEITRYGSLRAFADILKYSDASKLIAGILKQEKAADEKLTQIAEDQVDLAAIVDPVDGSETKSANEKDKKHRWYLWS